MKKRLDLLLVERGLLPTREKAQAVIIAGQVLVDDQPAMKPGTSYPEDAEIRIRGELLPFVSRGGFKLDKAIEVFGVEVAGRVALDVGASTGGFTDVLLQRGVQRVFALDVGHSQLDWKIRQDPRVIVMEKINARYLEFDTIGTLVDLIVIDVSFISLDKILPPLVAFATPMTDWVTLIKPQFEVGKDKVGRGGVVTSEEARLEACERLKTVGESLGLDRLGLIDSPITGTQGNQEYLAHWKLRS